jgi:hypothetical protein
MYFLNRQMTSDERLAIVVKDPVPVKTRFVEIHTMIAKEKKRQEAERLDREEKLKATREKKEAKARERELKLLERLKSKYESIEQ